MLYREHWVIKLLNQLKEEQNLSLGAISLLSGLHKSNLSPIFRGVVLPSIPTLERILAVFEYDLDAVARNGEPNGADHDGQWQCYKCGSGRGFINVHGHIACRQCGGVLESCCED